MSGVPKEVLYAFNLDGDITPLKGGQGTSYRINHAVVKPIDATHNHEYLFKALSKIQPSGYRLSQFVESRFGRYIFDGWCCTRFEPGYEVRGGLATKLAVSRMFHRDLSEITYEGFIECEDVYAVVHRIA